MQIEQRISIFLIILLTLLDEIPAWKNNFLLPMRLECDANPEWVYNYTCKLKPISRDRKLVIMKAELAKPISKIFGHGRLYKRFNGWQPFFINYSAELCAFVNGEKSSNKMYNHIYSLVKPLLFKYTNINHPCPYNGTVELYEVDYNKLDVPAARGTIMPEGYYKGIGTFYGPNNSYMGTITIQGMIKETKN